MKTKVTGHSMYPFLIEGRDIAHIKEVDITQSSQGFSPVSASFKPGDVLLFRHDSGILVLHRVMKVTDEGYYMLGDSQQKYQIEGPVIPAQIKGILTARERDGKLLYVTDIRYRMSAYIWRKLLWVRRPIQKAAASIVKIMRK